MVELIVVVQIRVADLEIREVVMRHVVVEMDLKGPVANCPSLTHRGYLVTFVLEEVLENSRKDGASLSSDDEDKEEVTDREAIIFPFSLLGFLKMSKGSMTYSWNVNLASRAMA
nr:hypothetical protein [Tanacetum cinerariifolium]